ncbi:MAG: hypothetical protein KC416_01570 [Myxococcales bacterium]|nr:hypothetical protein [Myxococcales bacterium]
MEGKIRALTFPGDELPFMEVDSPDEYHLLQSEFMPKLRAMEGTPR